MIPVMKPDFPLALTTPRPSPAAQAVYEYICGLPGKGILAGQQEIPHPDLADADELVYLQQTTGKLPAVLGLDYIHYPGVTQRAVGWWKRGGLPSICWHWGAPTKGEGYPASKETVDIEAALSPGTELNRVLMADLDRTAVELARLRDAGVPVLWRPLHESNGGWFWWGKAGPKPFRRLWKLMHDHFTRTHQLDNLIWVCGFTAKPKAAWYPGDAYVDIAGADNYATGPQRTMYEKLVRIVGPGRPVAYHECGPIPDPDALQAGNVNWVWFLTWHTKHIREQNKPEYLRKVYHHPYVITLDQVPDLGRDRVFQF